MPTTPTGRSTACAIFVDGGDLTVVLEGIIDFNQMLDRKIKPAQTRGLIYVDAVTGKPK